MEQPGASCLGPREQRWVLLTASGDQVRGRRLKHRPRPRPRPVPLPSPLPCPAHPRPDHTTCEASAFAGQALPGPPAHRELCSGRVGADGPWAVPPATARGRCHSGPGAKATEPRTCGAVGEARWSALQCVCKCPGHGPIRPSAAYLPLFICPVRARALQVARQRAPRRGCSVTKAGSGVDALGHLARAWNSLRCQGRPQPLPLLSWGGCLPARWQLADGGGGGTSAPHRPPPPHTGAVARNVPPTRSWQRARLCHCQSPEAGLRGPSAPGPREGRRPWAPPAATSGSFPPGSSDVGAAGSPYQIRREEGGPAQEGTFSGSPTAREARAPPSVDLLIAP